MRGRVSLVDRLLVVEVVTVLLTVLIAGGVSAANTRSLVEADTGERVAGIARALAAAPGVPAAVAARDPAVLQPAAEAVRAGSGVSFVTVMDPAGTRFSHPDPALIGQSYRGTLPAGGDTLVETFPGTLGTSVRAIVPVTGPDGGVVGRVAVGILSVDVAGRVWGQLGVLGLGALVAVALGVGLAVLAARRVRRDTLGLEPHEITALHRHHEAVLHAMREGLLVVEPATGRVVVVNDEAVRLLGLPGTAGHTGRTLTELGVEPALRDRLADPAPLTDASVLVGERLLLVSRTTTGTADPSSVVTLRDRTEITDVLRALDDARSVAGALRFQAHEHANHLQAVSTLIELGAHDDARDLAVRWTRDLTGTDGSGGLGAELRERIADPALAALVLDKATDARDRGLELRVSAGTGLAAAHAGDTSDSTDAVTVVGNLLDNALDAAAGLVELDLTADGDAVRVRVGDDGPGIADPGAAFAAGWSTKTAEPAPGHARIGGRGLGLALIDRVVRRRGGTVDLGPGPDGRGTTVSVTLPHRVRRDVGQEGASR